MPHCTICGAEFGKESSVRSHIQGKGDDDHSGIGYANADPYIESGSASASGSSTDESGGSSSGDNPLFSETTVESSGSSGGPGCCESPMLDGSAGDVFQLDDGSKVRLESGDKICVNCDSIHEN